MSTTVRHVGIPVQDLPFAMLGVQILLLIAVDNTQAIGAIKNWYSTKLKSLSKQHRVSIGAMNELYRDPDAALELEYVKTEVQKGDSSIKALGPQAFVAARDKLGMKKLHISEKVVANTGAAILPTRKASAKKGRG